MIVPGIVSGIAEVKIVNNMQMKKLKMWSLNILISVKLSEVSFLHNALHCFIFQCQEIFGMKFWTFLGQMHSFARNDVICFKITN